MSTPAFPWAISQCDLVRGAEHFRTPLSKGIEIMEYLRGRMSGIGIPQFVVDAPHGGGKIPLLPSYLISTSPSNSVLRNYEGVMVNYPEPRNGMGPAAIPENGSAPGVWDLSCGRASSIIPGNTERMKRRLKRNPSFRYDIKSPS